MTLDNPAYAFYNQIETSSATDYVTTLVFDFCCRHGGPMLITTKLRTTKTDLDLLTSSAEAKTATGNSVGVV